MIGYIEKKNIFTKRVNELLGISTQLNHFSNGGPVKQLLESKLESILELPKSKKVICLNNGTSALHALMFLFAKRGVKRWVTPSFTFPSCVTGGIFDVDVLDIYPDTFTLPMEEDILLPYDGIIITNIFGCDVGVRKWTEFCNRTGKTLIFDNASSPLTKSNGKNICTFGDASFGSLHHTKYLGFGEGGFVVIDSDLYNEIESIANFGFFNSRVYNPMSSNYKMSDISAAYILQHIENYNFDKHIEIQNEIIKRMEVLKFAKPILFNNETFYGNIPVLFPNKIDNTYFQQLGIITQKYYYPLESLPVANDIYDRIINFPVYASLNNKDVATIIKAIKTYERVMK